MAAADRLGITQYLQPDHLTANQAYRELAQTVKSVPGSQARAQEIEGLNEVGNRAASLIDELSGSFDLSAFKTQAHEHG
jgi:predicted glycosyltransferase